MRPEYGAEQSAWGGRIWRWARRGVLALVVCAAAVRPAAPADEALNPLRPADTSSPRATLTSFIDSCNELYDMILATKVKSRRDPNFVPVAERILDCLDLSDLPEYAREHAGGEAAVYLKEVLDRIELPPDEEIPDAEAIEAAGGPNELPSWRIPHTRITIARVEEGPRRGEYLFSPQTVDRVSEGFEYAKRLPYRTEGRRVSQGFHQWYLSEPANPTVAALVHRLPDWCGKRVSGLAIWQWVGLVLSVLIGAAVMYVVYRLGRTRGKQMREEGAFRYGVTLLFSVVAMFVPLVFKEIATDYLTIRGDLLYVVSFAANVVFLLALLVVLGGAGSRIAEIIIASPRIHPKGLDAQLIRIVCRVLSLAAAVIVFLEGGRYLGIPLTTLLASAGVGGLAVALAAQDTLKSLFGSVMILLDKPYRAGERVIVGNYDGVVEDIGLRSTKLRLLTGHQASIPNEEMARSRIENVGRRPYIRRIADVRIPLDTPRAKIVKAVEVIRAALDNHEGMEPDLPPRVYFTDFHPDAFNIRIIYWYHPPDYWDFLAFGETLNFEIFRAFEEQGIRFSLPARITYTTPDGQTQPLAVGVVGEGPPPGQASRESTGGAS